MSDIVCVTNRKLCREDFLVRIEKIAAAKPKAIVLREKDLSPEEYRELAAKVMKICGSLGVPYELHYFADVAAELGARAIRLPLQKLIELPEEIKARFDVIGASCHSKEDALLAQKAGAAYITAGHVFATDCKKGLPPRGLDFLREVCEAVTVPVYAIGGISPENIASVREAGAAGACVMSGLMTREDPAGLLREFERVK